MANIERIKLDGTSYRIKDGMIPSGFLDSRDYTTGGVFDIATCVQKVKQQGLLGIAILGSTTIPATDLDKSSVKGLIITCADNADITIDGTVNIAGRTVGINFYDKVTIINGSFKLNNPEDNNTMFFRAADLVCINTEFTTKHAIAQCKQGGSILLLDCSVAYTGQVASYTPGTGSSAVYTSMPFYAAESGVGTLQCVNCKITSGGFDENTYFKAPAMSGGTVTADYLDEGSENVRATLRKGITTITKGVTGSPKASYNYRNCRITAPVIVGNQYVNIRPTNAENVLSFIGCTISYTGTVDGVTDFAPAAVFIDCTIPSSFHDRLGDRGIYVQTYAGYPSTDVYNTFGTATAVSNAQTAADNAKSRADAAYSLAQSAGGTKCVVTTEAEFLAANAADDVSAIVIGADITITTTSTIALKKPVVGMTGTLTGGTFSAERTGMLYVAQPTFIGVRFGSGTTTFPSQTVLVNCIAHTQNVISCPGGLECYGCSLFTINGGSVRSCFSFLTTVTCSYLEATNGQISTLNCSGEVNAQGTQGTTWTKTNRTANDPGWILTGVQLNAAITLPQTAREYSILNGVAFPKASNKEGAIADGDFKGWIMCGHSTIVSQMS